MRRLIGLLAALAAAVAAAPAAAAPKLPLSHAGRWITDAQGRVVILHGVNMVSKVAPYAPDAMGFGDDDARFLAANGFDTVRLGLIYKAVEPEPGRYDDAYVARIRKTVRTLAKHGIATLLDFHQDQYNERFQGEGFPDWAIQDDGLAPEPQLGFPNNYLSQPAVQRAFDNFWANRPGPGGVGLQDRYAAAWRHVAGRFADEPSVLGYDLFNEPWPGANWLSCLTPAGCAGEDAKLTAFTKRVVGAIRKADARHLVFYEPNALYNAGVQTRLGDVGGARAAMSFHVYCYGAKPDEPYTDTCRKSDATIFDNADAHAKKTGDALFVTEFGASRNPELLRAVTDAADAHMVGWHVWHYCTCQDPTTSGPGEQALVPDPAKKPAGANVDAEKLKILARPHPRAVSGTPASYGVDGRTFTLRYSTRRAGSAKRFAAGSITEVAIPWKAYRATAKGAKVTSKRDASVLTVAGDRGAATITVTVTRR